ncbi:hypothetical protein [Candidatus Phytoplasma sacchari]|nr:hypothetical protein [Candidatus Phytoplasma sacchari]KAB8121918.1 hypothetical protein F2B49_01960 [Candidatus Phytoplasma sacchari]
MIMKINNFALKEFELSFFTNSNKFEDIHFKLIELDDRRRCFIADVLFLIFFLLLKKRYLVFYWWIKEKIKRK